MLGKNEEYEMQLCRSAHVFGCIQKGITRVERKITLAIMECVCRSIFYHFFFLIQKFSVDYEKIRNDCSSAGKSRGTGLSCV